MSRACHATSLCKNGGPEDRGEQTCKKRFLGFAASTAPCWHLSQLGAVQDLGNFVVEPQSTLVLVEGSSLEGQLDGPDDFMQPFGFETVDLSWRSWSVATTSWHLAASPAFPTKGHVMIARAAAQQ